MPLLHKIAFREDPLRRPPMYRQQTCHFRNVAIAQLPDALNMFIVSG